MKSLKIHLFRWHRLYIAITAVWILRYFVPGAFQGASTQWGQDVYEFLNNFEKALSWLNWM